MTTAAEFARLRFVVLGLLSLSGWLIAQNSLSMDQLSFSAEDEVLSRAIPIPAEILAILSKDPDVVARASSDGPFSDSWFLAAELSLSGPRERSVLVIGIGPIRGANVTSFWLFRSRNGRFEMILKVTAHTLNVRDTRTSDYCDIEVMSASAREVWMRVFRFDGERYRLASTSSEVIR